MLAHAASSSAGLKGVWLVVSVMERRQRPRGSASVELWRTVRAAACIRAVRLRAVGLCPVGAMARAPRCATPRCRAAPCRSYCTRAAAAVCFRAARPRCAGEKVLARKCWRESAGVRADRVLASAPTEPLLGSTGQMSTAPSRRRRTASGARRTASDARPRRHGPGEHGATRATLNTCFPCCTYNYCCLD